MWKSILLFSCNWWWQKAWEVEKKYQLLSISQGSHSLVQWEKVSKTTKLTFNPPISLFPLQWSVSLFYRMCYERTWWLQLQGRFQRYSIFTSEPGPQIRLYIQWTKSIHTNPYSKAERLRDTVSLILGCSVVAAECQHDKEDFSSNCVEPAHHSVTFLSQKRMIVTISDLILSN